MRNGYWKKTIDVVEDLDRQARRQVVAAWFVTGGALVAVVVIYFAIVSALVGG